MRWSMYSGRKYSVLHSRLLPSGNRRHRGFVAEDVALRRGLNAGQSPDRLVDGQATDGGVSEAPVTKPSGSALRNLTRTPQGAWWYVHVGVECGGLSDLQMINSNTSDSSALSDLLACLNLKFPVLRGLSLWNDYDNVRPPL